MADIAEIIRQAAIRNGVPVEVMLRKAQIESNMDPNALNKLGSGAAGLFQFMPKTWGQYGQGQSPFDPVANADAAARFTKDNINTFKSRLGRDPSPGEIYLMHQQGASGALKLLSNPDAPAVSLVGKDEIIKNGGTPDMTAGQFASLWMSKFNGANPNAAPATAGVTSSVANAAAPFSLAGITPAPVAATPSEDDQMLAVAKMFGSLTPETEPDQPSPLPPGLRRVRPQPIKRAAFGRRFS